MLNFNPAALDRPGAPSAAVTVTVAGGPGTMDAVADDRGLPGAQGSTVRLSTPQIGARVRAMTIRQAAKASRPPPAVDRRVRRGEAVKALPNEVSRDWPPGTSLRRPPELAPRAAGHHPCPAVTIGVRGITRFSSTTTLVAPEEDNLCRVGWGRFRRDQRVRRWWAHPLDDFAKSCGHRIRSSNPVLLHELMFKNIQTYIFIFKTFS